MITIWRGTDGDTEPVACECEVFGYPHKTTDGTKMYENTHFLTRAEAWESVRKSVEAGIKLAARDVTYAYAALRKAEQHASEAVRAHAAYLKAREDAGE